MNKLLLLGAMSLLVWSACSGDGDYAPKPRGYFRIELPKKEYQKYETACPYIFDYPVYAKMVPDSLDRNAQPCWNDLSFPQFNGRIHLSYWQITSRKEFDRMTEDAYQLVYKHVVKATDISSQTIRYPGHNVYGVYYAIGGNTASSVQFYLTDSVKHYLRGSLYFREEPRVDSIKPVLDFVRKDIDVLIKTLRWK